MVADGELEANAIGHGMTNQQSEFQSFPYTTQIWIAMKSWCLPTTLQLHFRALQTLYLGPLLDHGSWQLLQKCNSCAATFAVEDLGSNGPNDQNSVEEQFLNPATTTTLREAPVRLTR